MRNNGKAIVTVLAIVAAGVVTSGVWWYASGSGEPVIFMLDCEAESPQPAWLSAGQVDAFETELCIPLIRELLRGGDIDAVAWQVLGSHFRVFLLASPGVDANLLQTSLASTVTGSKLRRRDLYAQEQYWIGSSPLLLRLAQKPEMDPTQGAGSKVIYLALDRYRAAALGLSLADVTESIAARLSNDEAPLVISFGDAQESLEGLGDTLVETESGAFIPLRDIGKFEVIYSGVTRPWIAADEFAGRYPDTSTGQ